MTFLFFREQPKAKMAKAGAPAPQNPIASIRFSDTGIFRYLNKKPATMAQSNGDFIISLIPIRVNPPVTMIIPRVNI